MGLWSDRTPEVMDHIEVADLWEKPSYSLSVVLSVSDGSGPAHRSDFNHNTGQNLNFVAIAPVSPSWLSILSNNEMRHRFFMSVHRTNGQVRARKRLLVKYFETIMSSSKANNGSFKSESLLVEAQISFFCCNLKKMFKPEALSSAVWLKLP